MNLPAVGLAGLPRRRHDVDTVVAGHDAGKPGIADPWSSTVAFLNISAATAGLLPAMTPSTLMPDASKPLAIAFRAALVAACVLVIAGGSLLKIVLAAGPVTPLDGSRQR